MHEFDVVVQCNVAVETYCGSGVSESRTLSFIILMFKFQIYSWCVNLFMESFFTLVALLVDPQL
jgi:hypothetical protein